MKDYDLEEAKALFTRATGANDSAGKSAAAKALQRAVEEVIRTGKHWGAEELPHLQGKLAITHGNSMICTMLFDFAGVRLWKGERDDNPRALELRYYADTGLFVGPDITAANGVSAPKNAVTHVIEEILAAASAPAPRA